MGSPMECCSVHARASGDMILTFSPWGSSGKNVPRPTIQVQEIWREEAQHVSLSYLLLQALCKAGIGTAAVGHKGLRVAIGTKG